jgi:hypothetical protein
MSSTSATTDFDNCTDELFGAGSPARLVCKQNGITSHRKLREKFKSDLKELEYEDPTTGRKVKLGEDDLLEVGALISFMNAMQNETGPRMECPLDMTEFSRGDFERYMDNSYDPDNPDVYSVQVARESQKHREEMELMREQRAQLAAATANTMAGGGNNSTSTSSNSGGGSGHTRSAPDPLDEELRMLKKSEKPDSTKFNKLEKEIDYSEWIVAFENEAKLQGFGNVLDENFTIPTDAKEKKVFESRQKLLFSTLNQILLTSKGKDLLATYSKTTDAQRVLIELRKHHTTSVVAESMATKFRTKLLTAEIKPHLNKEDQIVEFKGWIRALNSYLPAGSQLTPEDKVTYLKRFCSGSPGMKTVPALTSIVQEATGFTLTPEVQSNIIEQQALMFDHNPETQAGNNTRRANQAMTYQSDDGYQVYIAELDDDDDCYTIMEVDASGIARAKSRVPKSIWTLIPDSDKEHWLSISHDTRRQLLHAFDNSNNSSQHGASAQSTSSPLPSAIRQRAQPPGQRRLRNQ